MRGVATQAIIRNGDYPGEKGAMDIVVILSQLKDVERVRSYYTRAASLAGEIKQQEAAANGPSVTEESSEDIPTLL